MRKLLILLITAAFCSCQNYGPEESIMVYYEPSNIIQCCHSDCASLLKEATRHHRVDTVIYVPNNVYNDLATALQTAKTTKKECDITCKIIIKHKERCLGVNPLGDITIIDTNNRITQMPSKVLYDIKLLTGYYNYLSKESLSHDEGVRLYGIPKNYHEETTDSFKTTSSTGEVRIVHFPSILPTKKVLIKPMIFE